ncbi:MAG TPA: hypothetical protein VK582_22690 [Pyrinomonadaceae bacterium]|nr:hypothetical protein [Pyrinomonadaceae bacterium]
MKTDPDMTRYLCATAYLNCDFRNKVIENLLYERHRAIGLCHGVDLPILVKHCLAARRRVFFRDMLVVSLFPITLFLTAFILPEAPRDLSDFGNLIVIWLLSFSLSFMIVAWETWTRHEIVSEHFLKDNYDPNYSRIKVNAKTTLKLQQITEKQNANVVVYSGFSPFVGSGMDMGGWSFSLNVRKGREDLGKRREPQDFEIGELYSSLVDSMVGLNFEGLITEDRLFVNGKDIRNDRRFLLTPLSSPESTVGTDLIDEFKTNPSHAVRHYMCVKITDWKGELVLSIFLRLAKNGGTFFTEANYFLLTPIAEGYRQADSMRPTPGFRATLKLLGVALVKGALIWFFWWCLLAFKVGRFFVNWGERTRRERLVAEDPTFDYGASGTLREYVSSYQYRRYFQKLDKEMYLKTVERLILDCVIEFLDEKGVDTSELRDRQATILNNGVIVTGGAVRAKTLAVGQNSSASSSG